MRVTLPRTLEAKGLELIGHSDLGGTGDGMQVMRNGDTLYVGHMGDFGVGTSVVDISDLEAPRLVSQTRTPHHVHEHKVQLADGLLLVNRERYPPDVRDPTSAGVLVYDASRPRELRRIGFLEIPGLGVHRMWWAGGRYAYVSARMPGTHGARLVTIDLADPSAPKVHATWHFPQQVAAGEDLGSRSEAGRFNCHHAIVRGDRAYAGWFDAGLALFSVRDGIVELISSLAWTEAAGGHPYTHTALPLGDRKLVAVTDEAIDLACTGARKDVHLIDVSDERRPREIAKFPVPRGDYCARGLRFGPHNLHENRPGTFQSDTVVYATYFNAGLRVYDTSDPLHIREIAHHVPEAPPGQTCIQFNDLLVDADGTIFVTDRVRGGLYIYRRTS
ncbi:MAG TPA: hypothetical protein DCK98_06510 [Chloroflexi bacterium]|nr:hypothetical protein [Chloroflexota bacterium]